MVLLRRFQILRVPWISGKPFATIIDEFAVRASASNRRTVRLLRNKVLFVKLVCSRTLNFTAQKVSHQASKVIETECAFILKLIPPKITFLQAHVSFTTVNYTPHLVNRGAPNSEV